MTRINKRADCEYNYRNCVRLGCKGLFTKDVLNWKCIAKKEDSCLFVLAEIFCRFRIYFKNKKVKGINNTFISIKLKNMEIYCTDSRNTII